MGLQRNRGSSAAIAVVVVAAAAMSPPPPLKLQFGSALHTVYNRPFHKDHVVIAPSLFGSELNVTTYHGLRDELQEFMRDVKKRPDWSFESDTRPSAMVPFPPRDLTARSATFQDVVRRMCEYFAVDPASTGVGVAFWRGRPVCHYRGGPKYVHRLTSHLLGGYSPHCCVSPTPLPVIVY